MFSYPWEWVTLFYTHLPQSKAEVTPYSPKRRKFFEPWLKKYTWQVYDRDGNFIYCKICKKAKKSCGYPRAEIFKILHSFVLLVFKNTQSPTCVNMYMLFVPMGMDTCSWIWDSHSWPRTCSLLAVRVHTHYRLFLGGSLFHR